VLRQEDGNQKQVAMRVRYKDIISAGHLAENILLKPGDTIIVP
jgi:hypothetical protein